MFFTHYHLFNKFKYSVPTNFAENDLSLSVENHKNIAFRQYDLLEQILKNDYPVSCVCHHHPVVTIAKV